MKRLVQFFLKGRQTMEAQQVTLRRPWWGTMFSIALGSAVFATVMNIIDSVINQNFAISKDKLTAASAYLLIGGWFGVVVCLVLGKLLGFVAKLMNVPREVKPEKVGGMSIKNLAILAGVFSAFATLVTLWGYQLNDLGVMSAVTNAFLIVIVLVEWRSGKVTLKSLLLPSLLTIVSICLIAYSTSWRTNTSTLVAEAPELLFILVSASLLIAGDKIASKKAVDYSSSVNVQIIRFTTLAITATVLTLGWALLRGQWSELMTACGHILGSPAVYVLLTLLFVAVFLSQVLDLQARKIHKNVSEVVVVQSLNVGLGFMASLLINQVHTGLVGPVPTDTETLVVRIIGVAGLMLALVLLPMKKNIE